MNLMKIMIGLKLCKIENTINLLFQKKPLKAIRKLI